MTARIFTGDEAAALLADYTATPRITFGDECLGGVPLCVDGRELLYTEGDDTEGDWIYVDRWEAAMHDAAPDLAASVEHHAARADAAEASVHQLTMERDGARKALDASQEARIKQSLELADACAEVVRLRAELDASRDRELTLDKLAPRAELPTPAEVLAVAEERDGDNSSVVQVLCAHTLYGVTGAMYTVAAVAVRGGVVQAITEEAAENLRAADGFILLAHEGPVPWAWLTPLPPPARPFGLVINSEIADAIDGVQRWAIMSTDDAAHAFVRRGRYANDGAWVARHVTAQELADGATPQEAVENLARLLGFSGATVVRVVETIAAQNVDAIDGGAK